MIDDMIGDLIGGGSHVLEAHTRAPHMWYHTRTARARIYIACRMHTQACACTCTSTYNLHMYVCHAHVHVHEWFGQACVSCRLDIGAATV